MRAKGSEALYNLGGPIRCVAGGPCDFCSWHFSGKTISLNLGLLIGVKQTYRERTDYRRC